MQEGTIIKLLVGLIISGGAVLVAPYVFIFKYIWRRISELEKRPICPVAACNIRFDKVEKEISDSNPIFIEIKERLASIETTLKFLTERK